MPPAPQMTLMPNCLQSWNNEVKKQMEDTAKEVASWLTLVTELHRGMDTARPRWVKAGEAV